MKAKNINYCWAELMVEELVRQGVTYFCVAPGSRSSALTVAVANHKKTQSVVHVDERGLAFHALGYVAATSKPAVLICTSGTAGANFYPAIIEASKKKLPLIVLTADRPPELHYTGAMQTIDQTNLFGSYAKWFLNMPCPTTDIQPQMVLTTIDQAVHQANAGMRGVVHINCMFREPLAPIKDKTSLGAYLKPISAWQKQKTPYTTYSKEVSLGLIENIQSIADDVNQMKKGVVVVGKLASEAERQTVLTFAQSLNIPILADVSSGLRLGYDDDIVIGYMDQVLLSSKTRRALKPDGVIHLGGRITSKRYYQWIEEQTPKTYIMVLGHALRNDPLHCVTHRVQSKPAHFCDALIPHLNEVKSEIYLEQWQAANQRVALLIEKEHQAKRSIELSVARTITQHIPDGEGLFVSNSMPVRLVDMYGDARAGSVVFGANRGASGIDGIVATAIGFAQGLDERVTCLIGDVAMLYDMNSLAMIKSSEQPVIFVVLNNSGGEIFGHLPIAENSDHFKRYFQTEHNFKFKDVANMFGLNYIATSSKAGFKQAYQKALRSRKSVIFDVKVDAQQSLKDQKAFYQRVAANLNK